MLMKQLVLLSFVAGGFCVTAQDADPLPDLVTKLKALETVSNASGVLELTRQAAPICTERLAEPKPADEAAAKDWVARQDYARQVKTYLEYALMNQAGRATDPSQSLAVTEELEKMNPESQYLGQSRNATFNVLRQGGQMEKAVEIAEKQLQREANEEMLLVAADYSMKKNDSAKVLAYSSKLVETISVKPKPDGVSDADWQKRKSTLAGAGNWMTGVTLATENKFADADKSLREALPLLTDDQMKAAALFHLGVANFRLGETGKAANLPRIQDAYTFSKQCSAIKSPYAANCQKNVTAIQTKYRAKVK
jgi:tetratricopeptide (TPR) repeat protein